MNGPLEPPKQRSRVLKLGGSLLAWDRWPDELRGWLRRQRPAANVLLVGGGPLADVVREWDKTHRLNASAAHWLAIDTMSLTARLAAQLLPEAKLTTRIESVAEQFENRQHGCDDLNMLTILEPREFLECVEPSAAGRKLPHGWQTTSDSIAARLAVVLGSEELVLMKSTLPSADGQRNERSPDVTTLRQAALAGFVDAFLPEAAAEIPRVRCVNLRSRQFTEWIAHRE